MVEEIMANIEGITLAISCMLLVIAAVYLLWNP